MQSRHIADPQIPQPVEFCPIPILLLKYETFRKQLGQNVKMQSQHFTAKI